MSMLTVRCPQCTLTKIFDGDGVLPADCTNDEGQPLCPNCEIPMLPLGEGDVVTAEQAFKAANDTLRQGEATAAPVETEDTLRKRLAEIRAANQEVTARASVLEEAKQAASEAKKHYDAAVITLRNVTERMTRVPTGDGEDLPLFTPAAEQNAQASAADPVDHPSAIDEQLLIALGDAGAGIHPEAIADWTPTQRLAAWAWATNEGTVESMPDHVVRASDERQDAPIDVEEDVAASQKNLVATAQS